MNKASRKKPKPESWREVKLGEIAEIITGKTPPTKKKELYGDKYPFITPTDISEASRFCKPSRYLSEQGKNRQISSILPENSICYTCIASIGKICITTEDSFTNQQINTLKVCAETVEMLFIFYYLKYLTPKIISMAGGTINRIINKNLFSSIEISIPPLAEQRAIAEVLSSLDDKIDLLHRQNKTLEDMAQTLFRQWFIEGEKADWAVGTLSDEFDVTMGQSPPGISYNEEKQGVPLFQGNADFGFRFPRNRVWTTEPKRCAEQFDTLISVRAPVGEQNMAIEKCCIGRGVAAFRYKKNRNFRSYTYYKIKSLVRKIRQFNQEGTVFGSISKRGVEDIEIVLPPFESIKGFQNITKLFDQKIVLNNEQIGKLEKLRETLLPKLMNGAVRVQVLNN